MVSLKDVTSERVMVTEICGPVKKKKKKKENVTMQSCIVDGYKNSE